MAWLETLPGVARKNSAGVMNASTFERRAMVIDGHHRRIMQRMGIVPANADTAKSYEQIYSTASHHVRRPVSNQQGAAGWPGRKKLFNNIRFSISINISDPSRMKRD